MTTYRGITIHPDLSITKAQARNFIDLAAALREVPPPKFDMELYANSDIETKRAEDFLFSLPDRVRLKLTEDDPWAGSRLDMSPANMPLIAKLDPKNVCGTSCCAAGTGAYRGIGKPRKGEGYVEYSSRAFGADGIIWDWAFSSEWSGYDNTPKGAAARILYLIETGTVPAEYDHYSERNALPNIYKPYRRHKIEPKPTA